MPVRGDYSRCRNLIGTTALQAGTGAAIEACGCDPRGAVRVVGGQNWRAKSIGLPRRYRPGSGGGASGGRWKRSINVRGRAIILVIKSEICRADVEERPVARLQ